MWPGNSVWRTKFPREFDPSSRDLFHLLNLFHTFFYQTGTNHGMVYKQSSELSHCKLIGQIYGTWSEIVTRTNSITQNILSNNLCGNWSPGSNLLGKLIPLIKFPPRPNSWWQVSGCTVACWLVTVLACSCKPSLWVLSAVVLLMFVQTSKNLYITWLTISTEASAL